MATSGMDSGGAATASGGSEDGGGEQSSSTGGPSSEESERSFECNICLDTARDAVVSMCGHLFCWPCLHQWLETRPQRQICPVCKAAISKDKVVPLYGRGGENKDPREKVPPRPQGQREEPAPSGPFSGFGMGQGGGGFHMSFGIGAFPFGFLATNLNLGDERPEAAEPGTARDIEEQFLHKVFLWVAFGFILWLLIA